MNKKKANPQRDASSGFALNFMVPPTGIEPVSQP